MKGWSWKVTDIGSGKEFANKEIIWMPLTQFLDNIEKSKYFWKAYCEVPLLQIWKNVQELYFHN